MNITTLYRPVGLKELELILEADCRAFPPRLFWQPIFYPVTNQPYAAQIAREWNTNDEFSGYCGVVTAFDIPSTFLERYPVQNVGGDIHNELWVPAEELNDLNQQISGTIRFVAAFFGHRFRMPEHPLVAAAFQTLR